jgi:hypothetical protein
MITRAYQNAQGERQEISLFVEEWEALTEEGLQRMLGFSKEPEPVAEPEEKFEPVPHRAPAKKKRR